MALVIGEWDFPAGAAPSLPVIANVLRRNTGLEVAEKGPARDTVLTVTKLGESLFDWRIDPDRITVHGFAPAHPFLWQHLHAALGGFGGVPSGRPEIWRPDPAQRLLRQPWKALPRRERLILRLPSIAAARPLDRLLRRSTAQPG